MENQEMTVRCYLYQRTAQVDPVDKSVVLYLSLYHKEKGTQVFAKLPPETLEFANYMNQEREYEITGKMSEDNVYFLASRIVSK
jgi:hypothetical protein